VGGLRKTPDPPEGPLPDKLQEGVVLHGGGITGIARWTAMGGRKHLKGHGRGGWSCDCVS